MFATTATATEAALAMIQYGMTAAETLHRKNSANIHDTHILIFFVLSFLLNYWNLTNSMPHGITTFAISF